MEVNWLSLTNEWQVPEFWPQENTYEFLPELFQKNTEWKHFALRRFLELALIRARIAFVLRVPGRCPQSIELVTEIGCPLPKTYHELVSFCERAIPESWNRVDPMIGLNLLGVRLTDGGLEGKVAMLAATDFAEAERRQLRRLYFTENCVSFIGKEPGGVAKRYKNFREVIGAYVAQGWEISDVQPLSVAQPNLHLATFYDKKEIFTGRDFCEEDWSPTSKSPDGVETPVLKKTAKSSTRTRSIIVDTHLRDFLAKHHRYAEGQLGELQHATWKELLVGSGLRKATLSNALDRAFSEFNGTAFEKYKRACSAKNGLAKYLIRSHDHQMPSAPSVPLRCTDGAWDNFDAMEASDLE